MVENTRKGTEKPLASVGTDSWELGGKSQEKTLLKNKTCSGGLKARVQFETEPKNLTRQEGDSAEIREWITVLEPSASSFFAKAPLLPPTTACFKKHLILWKHKSDSHGIGCTPLSQSNILRPFPLEIISAAKNSCLISRMSQPFCHVLILNWTVEPLMKERGRKSPSTVEESKGEFLTEKVKCSSVAFHEYTY